MDGLMDCRTHIHCRLKRLITAAPVVLFMKGSPAKPRCGFSNKMVDLLKGEVRRDVTRPQKWAPPASVFICLVYIYI